MNEMVMMSWNIVQRACEPGRKHADIVITPLVAAVSLMDFGQAQVAYDAGVVAAEAAMNEVRELVKG
jgi:predicted acylesterase/phospholipase RssA